MTDMKTETILAADQAAARIAWWRCAGRISRARPACSRAFSTPRGPSAGAARPARAPPSATVRRGAQAQHGHRDQHRVGRLSRRPMDLPRRAGLDRVPARLAFAALAVCDTAVIVCEPSPERVVALSPLAEIHRGQSHPPRLLRQQDRFGRGPRARHAGGAADRLVAQAGAAPGADPPADQRRRRGDDRLCRPRERARLPLQVERRLRPDRDARRDPAAREPRHGARCSRRCRSSTTRCSSS